IRGIGSRVGAKRLTVRGRTKRLHPRACPRTFAFATHASKRARRRAAAAVRRIVVRIDAAIAAPLAAARAGERALPIDARFRGSADGAARTTVLVGATHVDALAGAEHSRSGTSRHGFAAASDQAAQKKDKTPQDNPAKSSQISGKS